MGEQQEVLLLASKNRIRQPKPIWLNEQQYDYPEHLNNQSGLFGCILSLVVECGVFMAGAISPHSHSSSTGLPQVALDILSKVGERAGCQPS
jgi:hypothetical protein